MIAFATAAWAKIKGEASFLVLLAVAVAGAALYVQLAESRREVTRLEGDATAICAAAGESFAASVERVTSTKGKPVDVKVARGQRCRARIAALVSFRADTERATAETLAKALRERDAKTGADARAAREATEALARATSRMEQADAEAARRNQVDRPWWAAVNDVAGLRSADR